jgi:pimeloyl-ACP methyl ester carboxylesterase
VTVNRLTRAYYHSDTSADEVLEAFTEDGWALALSRTRPRGPRRRRRPVVLLHGFSSNRYTWDLRPDVSYARHLAEQGYDVYNLELRGHGLSEAPGLRRPGDYTWRLWDYVEKDVPAALRKIRELNNEDALFVGHSMGGIILYGYLATMGGEGVHAGVTIGSAVDYSSWESGYHEWKKAQKLLDRIPYIPFEPALRTVAPLTGRIPNKLEIFNVNPDNVDGKLMRRLYALGMSTVSPEVTRDLATAFDPSGLKDRMGHEVKPRLRSIRAPILAIAGTDDRQCPTGAARTTLLATGQDEGQVRLFGKHFGHSADYGHFDLIFGPRARSEVWPTMDAWLEQHDG